MPSKNKANRTKATQDYWKRHPDKLAAYKAKIKLTGYHINNHLQDNYNLTIEDYAWMWHKQNGLCSICGKAPTRFGLVVDHNHQTGEVRGLLCSPCNSRLGTHEDYHWRLLADTYVRRFKDGTNVVESTEGDPQTGGDHLSVS